MRLRVVTVAGSLERETQLAAELATDPAFDLAFRCLERSELLASLRAGGIDAVVSVGVAAWFDFQCMEEASRARVRLYGLAGDPVEADMLEVAGYTLVRDLAHLAESTSTPPPPQPAPDAPMSRGKIIAVWGAKGAPGRTTVAIELATVLAQARPSTLLVDADLYGGDIAQLLGVGEELPGLVPICRMAARGETRDDSWVQELRRLPSGPAVVPGVLRAELWREVSTFGWEQLLDAARVAFTTTVLDVGFCLESSPLVREPAGRNDVAIKGVDAADQVVAVVRSDPIGIRSFLWSWADQRELVDPDRCVVVLNRVQPGEEGEVARLVRRHIGRPPLVLIPDRPDHLAVAVWEGTALVVARPSSPVSAAIRDLAAALGGEVRPRGFLTRLAGRHLHV